MKTLSTSEFRSAVYAFYSRNRRDLPWRETHDPYCILVSEIMLQQTQVERVIPKYESFISKFPDFEALSSANSGEVIREWQGLGYNRRAVALTRIADCVVEEYNGDLPENEDALRDLPGIGKATAAAIMAFAFGQPSVLIETNIRRVFIHCFFPEKGKVSDREILPLVEVTLDRRNPRDWYYALMDLGSALKKKENNPNRKSTHYRRQSPFEGSNRQLRGQLVRILAEEEVIAMDQVLSRIKADPDLVRSLLLHLEEEGFLAIKNGTVRIA
ncbi:MAG TPA: A/G-specific adenine glycosylase [Methanoregulaceae archaeon]|nr:A/G-specific adenine glycosylase [Methanoregulaceae archaeon]